MMESPSMEDERYKDLPPPRTGVASDAMQPDILGVHAEQPTAQALLGATDTSGGSMTKREKIEMILRTFCRAQSKRKMGASCPNSRNPVL